MYYAVENKKKTNNNDARMPIEFISIALAEWSQNRKIVWLNRSNSNWLGHLLLFFFSNLYITCTFFYRLSVFKLNLFNGNAGKRRTKKRGIRKREKTSLHNSPQNAMHLMCLHRAHVTEFKLKPHHLHLFSSRNAIPQTYFNNIFT